MTENSITEPNVNEEIRRRFESVWLAGNPRPIESFVRNVEQLSYLPALEELVHIELEFAWAAWSNRRSSSRYSCSSNETLRAPAGWSPTTGN